MDTANERREEILRILANGQLITMGELAYRFDKSVRTIQSDINILSRNHRIKSIPGNGGGVRLEGGYNPYNKFLTEDQRNAMEIVTKLSSADEQDKMVVMEMVANYGESIRKKPR